MSWKDILKEELGFGLFPEKEVSQAKALIYTITINEGKEAGERAKEDYFLTGRFWALYESVVDTADIQVDYKFPDTLPDGTKIDWDVIF